MVDATIREIVRAAAGADLQQAHVLAMQLRSPSLVYPLAYDFGQWCATTGQESQAAALYATAKATLALITAALEEPALRATFQQTALVQTIRVWLFFDTVHLMISRCGT